MINYLIQEISKLNDHGYFDYFAYIIIPVLVMILNIWAVNINTNRQIKNQNKETYKPRLKLLNFQTVQHFDNELVLMQFVEM
ncbi:MAG: hypothetical protein PHD15_06165 [Clostridia bacterium]|nr:hypothetical protein [Clostridia bacterium]MDD4387315.1 hypothetical protein [Clostridia bacterium]